MWQSYDIPTGGGRVEREQADEALREEDVTAADRLDDDVREAEVEEADPGED